MNEELVQFGLTAFVTLLVVIDPPGVVPIFVSLTEGADAARRHAIGTRAVMIAFIIALFFLLAGRSVLSYLGVTIHAFAISGGVLLFATALPMLCNLSSAHLDTQEEANLVSRAGCHRY
jgi:multiple antibiotic resistance protein